MIWHLKNTWWLESANSTQVENMIKQNSLFDGFVCEELATVKQLFDEDVNEVMWVETLEWHIFYGGIFLLSDSSKPVVVCFIHSLKIYPVSIKKKKKL